MNNDNYAIVPADTQKWVSIQEKTELSQMQINKQLMVLSTAFPTIVRNYDQYEYKAMQELWYSIFKNVPEELFQEGVKRYIINDRKGFFPSPGQIVGIILGIVQERENAEFIRRILERDCRREEAGGENG